MRRTEVLQGLRVMKFEEIPDRFRSGRLSAQEASDWLGVSERTFRRWRERYDEAGADGLLDRRLGKVSPHRIGTDEVDRITALYRDRYAGWTVKHFHERASERHGLKASYGWTKSVLHAAGLVRPAPRRSAHRKKRPRRPLPGLMLHQDGSRHLWVGLSGISCAGRVEHQAAIALVKRSPKMTANWALAMHHSRGGIFHSFSERFKTRKRSFIAASSVGKWPLARTARRSLEFRASMALVTGIMILAPICPVGAVSAPTYGATIRDKGRRERASGEADEGGGLAGVSL